MMPATASTVVRLLAVVVLYRTAPEASLTLRSLLQASAEMTEEMKQTFDASVLVWDNTPGGQTPSSSVAELRYYADPTNPGLAVAYNTALGLASAEGFEWLLTLDQDTEIPLDFFIKMATHIRSVHANVAAILPRVVADDRRLSPYRLFAGALPQWFRPEVQGVRSGVYALNSGSVLRVAALQSVGGYDPDFTLDMSDVAIFHKLNAAGHQALVVNDISLQHELSLLKKSERMTLDRYKASLRAEALFYDRHMGPLGRMERMVRLVVRSWRDWRDPASQAFSQATVEELRKRISRR